MSSHELTSSHELLTWCGIHPMHGGNGVESRRQLHGLTMCDACQLNMVRNPPDALVETTGRRDFRAKSSRGFKRPRQAELATGPRPDFCVDANVALNKGLR